jgi:hypothetical protein
MTTPPLQLVHVSELILEPHIHVSLYGEMDASKSVQTNKEIVLHHRMLHFCQMGHV